VVGDDVLVRGDDRLPRTERCRDERVSRLGAAHQLDDDVRVGIGNEMRRRVGQEGRRQPPPASGVDVTDGDPDEL
jgi:hypothetical protein